MTLITPNQMGSKPSAPIRIVKIAALVRTARTRHAISCGGKSRRRTATITNAPPAPMRATSVAVKIPPQRPPITNRKSKPIAQTPLSAPPLGPGGPRRGGKKSWAE